MVTMNHLSVQHLDKGKEKRLHHIVDPTMCQGLSSVLYMEDIRGFSLVSQNTWIYYNPHFREKMEHRGPESH